jgi:hypothetical protein
MESFTMRSRSFHEGLLLSYGGCKMFWDMIDKKEVFFFSMKKTFWSASDFSEGLAAIDEEP